MPPKLLRFHTSLSPSLDTLLTVPGGDWTATIRNGEQPRVQPTSTGDRQEVPGGVFTGSDVTEKEKRTDKTL